jgi:hypothetical protein
MLSVANNPFMLSAIILSVTVLSVIILNVITLSVVIMLRVMVQFITNIPFETIKNTFSHIVLGIHQWNGQCATGRRQSPIDIASILTKTARMEPLVKKD